MKYATIDIETTGLNRYKDRITFIGVGICETIKSKAWIETFDFTDERTFPDELGEFQKLCADLRKNQARLVWQNGKFDTLFIENKFGISLPIHEDVMLMGTAYDLAAPHGLKKMAKRYLGVEDWDISSKEKTSNDPEKVLPYLKDDVKYTWKLFQYFTKAMSEEQVKIYKKLLKPAYLMYRDVERTGIYFDVKQFKKVKKKYKLEEKEKGKILTDQYDINWNSAPQIQEVLFKKERIPPIKTSAKTGKPSADAASLKRLAVQGYTLPQQILDYKTSNTVNKMFLNRWEEDSSYDGRIHSSFNLTNVVTGRTSSSDPNLQQVPRLKDIRGLFTAPKGRLLFEADYSQLELRIAADYSNDKTMLEVYKTGGDIHTETARTLAQGREPTSEDRTKAKPVNFGFLYGMSARGFIDYAFNNYGVVFTMSEATLYRELFFAKYSGLLPWHRKQEQLCELLGGVANKFGRFRALPDIYSSSWSERSGAQRRAINTPVQGTGSDILIGAATEINKKFKKEGVNIVGTIHDSILGEFNEGDEDWLIPEVKRIMSRPKIMDDFGVELKVKLEADVGIGAWGSK